jgi:hypothetical protein
MVAAADVRESALLRTMPDREAAAADAAGKARATPERLARAERGEDVGGIGKRMTRKELIAAIGCKPADVRHALWLVEIEERGAHADLMDKIMKRHRLAEKGA